MIGLVDRILGADHVRIGAPTRTALFVAGLLVGALLSQTGTAQDSRPRALSRVGVAVKDFDASIAYYTRTLGLREAYALKQSGRTARRSTPIAQALQERGARCGARKRPSCRGRVLSSPRRRH